MANSYVVGSLVRVSSYGGTIASPTLGYRDINGTLIDPTAVILIYRDGLGNRTSVTYPTAPIIKDGVGLYHADLDTTGKVGNWDYEWASTGTGQAANKNTFQVTPGV
jgi:hypothetical protein